MADPTYPALAAHLGATAATDPHPGYATDAELAAGLAGKEAAGAADAAVAAHEAAADPHPQYLTAAEGAAAFDALGSAAAAQAAAEAFARQRSNHTGTQTLATISDAGTAAAKNAPASGNAAAGEVVLGNDTRLTDPRTPTAHPHALGDLTQSGATNGQVPLWNGSAWVPANASGGNLTLISSGNFAAGASQDISVPAGFRSYELVCRNMTHSHTAASRFQVQFLNSGGTAQTLRTNTTAATALQSDASFGDIGVGLNADAEIKIDCDGTYFRGIRSRFCGKQTATTTTLQAGGGMTANGVSNIHYSTVLESTSPITTLRLSWTLGNIAATGNYALYGVI